MGIVNYYMLELFMFTGPYFKTGLLKTGTGKNDQYYNNIILLFRKQPPWLYDANQTQDSMRNNLVVKETDQATNELTSGL